jgi:acyl-ACP thioesterase
VFSGGSFILYHSPQFQSGKPDMNSEIRFKEQFIVRASETGPTGKVRADSVANYLQEIAGNHASVLNFDVTDLQKNQMTWVLHQLHLKMDRMPDWRESIEIETWPSSGDRLRAYRDFRITDSENNVIGVALSYWVIMDMKSRRPVRIPQEIIDMRLPEGNHVLPLSGGVSISEISSDAVKFTVQRTDTDINRHVNNVAYIRWLCETVPEEVYFNKQCNEFNIQYMSEVLLGQVIAVKTEKSADSEQIYHTEIVNQYTGKQAAKILSIWI